MCHLKVILLVKGVGAQASSYKPNRDETQWWNRRDALVRCVAAFLFGPRSSSRRRELVLLYDEDWSRMHMTYEQQSPKESSPLLVPTEQTVVALWKRAASCNSGDTVELNGLTCRLEVSSRSLDGAIPTGFDSKRGILEHLQQTCSLDFLRKEGLNSSTNVILRKTNKKSLMQIWSRWMQQSPKNTNSNGSTDSVALESSLVSLLEPDSTDIETVIAATLHESSENELPYWNHPQEQQKSDQMANTQICMFLGAVRDMSMAENRCLERICKTSSIPLVAVRLGPVPEFTSKILSVVAFHHSQNVLGPAIHMAVQARKTGAKKRQQTPNGASIKSSGPESLHFVCLVPMPSSSLSVDLEKRDRSLWCMVRCTVASLWRSRLAGQSSSDGALNNRLTFVFSDGIHLTLLQDELVPSMAEKHQAAPSEYQILKALHGKLQQESVAAPDYKENILAILKSILDIQGSKPLCLLDVGSEKEGIDLARLFYSDIEEEPAIPSSGAAIVLLSMNSDNDSPLREQRKAFRRMAKKLDLPVLACSVSTPCQDFEATVFTFLQHLCYQNRFFGIMGQQQLSQNKRQKRK
jgi:hypothetical protein